MGSVPLVESEGGDATGRSSFGLSSPWLPDLKKGATNAWHFRAAYLCVLWLSTALGADPA